MSWRRTLAVRVLSLMAIAVAAWPLAAGPPIWELEAAEGRIRIAGSVHYLRPGDHPLPASLQRAFREADELVVEYDGESSGRPVRAVTLLSRVPGAWRLKSPGPLRRHVTARKFSDLRQLARERGFDIFRLDRMQTWFAGMYVVDQQLEAAGFDSALGVDNYLVSRAREEGKPVRALESAADQRRLFRDIPMSEQVDFLENSLEDAPRMGAAMARVVEHWRAGDTAWLERNLLNNLRRNPEEYERFSLARNRRWAESIAELAESGGNYLVVVGAMHLLAEDSLIALLGERGYEPRRWPTAESADHATPADP